MDDEHSKIKERIKKPLTNEDLERNTGVKVADIIKYSDLKDYNSIEDLLPTDNSFRIILIEDKYNSGHWVCILRYGKTIEYFNSYGAKWDTDWKFINRMIRLILGQETNEMTRLMNKAVEDGWKVVWNTSRYQKLDNKIQTCGRWVVMRIELLKMGFDLDGFKDVIEKFKKETGGSADYVVSKYVR